MIIDRFAIVVALACAVRSVAVRQWKAGRRLLLLLSTIVCLVSVGGSAAQEAVVRREYAIKAGVIGVLGKCVIWPEDVAPTPGAPLKIGILGKDPFVENGVNQLDQMVAAESLKGGHIVVM
jgi:hypothetical protein